MSATPRTPSRSARRRARALALSGGATTLAATLLAAGVTSGTAGATTGSDANTGAARTAAALGLGEREQLVVTDTVEDGDSTTHTRYERTYAGLPVLGGDLVVHRAADGAVTGSTKATTQTIDIASLIPKVTPAAAASGALRAARAERTTSGTDSSPRTVVWAASGKPVLAYETVVRGTQADGTPSRLHVVTDAATGKELHRRQAIDNGTGTSQYSGKVPLTTRKTGGTYQLTDTQRGSHSTYDLKGSTSGRGTLFTDADDVWGDGTPSNRQTAAVDAAFGAATTWDFYKSTFGRNGIKNDGKAPYSRVHYGNNYVNAFWDDQAFAITYGDGQGNKKPLTSLDVAGHEFSHGVTSATAGLKYSGESGGLNEATSDIFGTGVEFGAKNAADPGDYLIGEEIDIRGDGTPLRYQDKPSRDGKSADYWTPDIGKLDVHYSSGVANHFFYLLAEGSGKKVINGVSYDSPTKDGSTVTGIGRDKALRIWYKALTTYFTSTTDYRAARQGTLKAAADLYGANGTEVKAVAAAWTGVDVKS
ncbi:M4 family metallopeptidase [Streptomyces zagrosensis]|uniref:Neutral metalloproteinase n=1 Tax=Streptomyces zagrosensis TaxID=1042984 RepID=A0A7W9QEJ4_9ACTN|nr:M4 family metallopeptidase [Streptomyces zagrosensis]MBB5938499.1 Zn-dependent metalloprotease [Streptomyces zagrosensis]